MNKIRVTPITIYRITCKTAGGQATKRVETAKKAAEFVTLCRFMAWRRSCKNFRGNDYERMVRMEQRYLTVFKKHFK